MSRIQAEISSKRRSSPLLRRGESTCVEAGSSFLAKFREEKSERSRERRQVSQGGKEREKERNGKEMENEKEKPNVEGERKCKIERASFVVREAAIFVATKTIGC